MPSDQLTIASLKKKIANDRESGGLIFIKHSDEDGNPINFTIKGDRATSGIWRNGLTKGALTWVLVYQAGADDTGRVWVGSYAGAIRQKDGYEIALEEVKGPLKVRIPLSELTGKSHPQNPVYLTLQEGGGTKSGKELLEDIASIFDDESFKNLPTQKQQLILARLGQGKFRQNVLQRWDGACAVTGAKTLEVLRASHIIPWKSCLRKGDKIDPENGLPLVATLDALFDRGLISFSALGEMLISTKLSAIERKMFGLPANLRRIPSQKQQQFLEYHRGKVFKR